MSAREGAGGRGLVYERQGSGRPIVLLHGWCLSGRMWERERRALAERFDVIIPDLRGFGQSSGMPGPYDLDRYSSDVVDLLGDLVLRDAVLVGFAFGGAIAMAAAGDEDRIGGVVAIGLTDADEPAAFVGLAEALRADFPAFARQAAQTICVREQDPATLAELEQMFAATDPQVALGTVELLAGMRPIPLAEALRVPALFVHGSADQIAPVAIATACAEAAPDGEVAVVEGAGHLVSLDCPQHCLTLLQGFAGAER